MRVHRFAQQLLARTHDLVLLRLDLGQLHGAFALEHVLGEGRVLQDVGQHVQGEIEILIHHVRRNAEAVVARHVADVAADRFNGVGDLVGGAGLRSLQQHPRGELGDAVVGVGLGDDAAFHQRAEIDERQLVIFAHEQTQAVRQFELLNLDPGFGGFLSLGLGLCAFRIERGDRQIVVGEILRDDASDVLRRDLANVVEINVREIRVADQEFILREVGRLALHRLQRFEMIADRSLDRLLAFGIGHRLLDQLA